MVSDKTVPRYTAWRWRDTLEPSWYLILDVFWLEVRLIHSFYHWLVVSTPLKNISQLEWLFPIYMEKMFQTTNQIIFYRLIEFMLNWGEINDGKPLCEDNSNSGCNSDEYLKTWVRPGQPFLGWFIKLQNTQNNPKPSVLLVGGFNLPLWKIWVGQLGWWHSQLNGKLFKNPWFQSPPTRPCWTTNHWSIFKIRGPAPWNPMADLGRLLQIIYRWFFTCSLEISWIGVANGATTNWVRVLLNHSKHPILGRSILNHNNMNCKRAEEYVEHSLSGVSTYDKTNF